MSTVTIVDYGMGNLHSVLKKFRRIGCEPRVSSGPSDIASADKLVLPGVGHFGKAMQNLEQSGLRVSLDEAVVGRGVPILGICLGMQLFAKKSEEGDSEGLGWLDADVVRFRVRDTLRLKVPQMGWNNMEVRKESGLTRGLPQEPEFYFAHSYHLVCRDPSDVLGETIYDYRFPSAVERKNIYGVQFHPEKSHDVGETMLHNFLSL
jgi:glutamine amidotransferase